MRKITPLFISLLFLIFLGFMHASSSLALDPVAPRSDRPFGWLKVETPLPQTDLCEITGISNGYQLSFRPGEMIHVPIGQYDLRVKLQDNEWTSPITVTSTEFTDVVVPGYGNLKVQSPNPMDTVEVYSRNGQLLKRFSAAKIETLPIGTYDVRVTLGSDIIHQGNIIGNAMVASKRNVMIAPNTTRELIVSF